MEGGQQQHVLPRHHVVRLEAAHLDVVGAVGELAPARGVEAEAVVVCVCVFWGGVRVRVCAVGLFCVFCLFILFNPHVYAYKMPNKISNNKDNRCI